MDKKIVIFSCNFGNYDKIIEPLFKDSNVSYILFTDNSKLKTNIWKKILIDRKYLNIDPQIAAREIKLRPHLYLPKNHEINVWIDSCYQIRVINWEQFITLNLQTKDICLFKHPKRNCVYEEINECEKLKLDYSYLLNKQKEKYLKKGLPFNFGVYHTAVLIRKNNEKIKIFNELWREELINNSKRDQISFTYCLWKLEMETDIIKKEFGINLYKSEYFKRFKHLKPHLKYD